MNKYIYELLFKFSSNGYKSYIVGGYVRDFLLGLNNYDLDIVTNAPADFVLQAFKEYNPVKLKYDTVKFKYFEYDVDIAQIRSEKYINGNLVVKFTDDLKKDYLRRDFTFNAIYMDQDGNITDFGHCIEDLHNSKLRFVFDPNTKCIEDPTRILRAIYFILKYNISSYDDVLDIHFEENPFIKCDINALNRIIYKILKLGKNKEFIVFLVKCEIYDYLFKKECDNFNIKPIDFLNDFGYIFIDSIKKNN